MNGPRLGVGLVVLSGLLLVPGLALGVAAGHSTAPVGITPPSMACSLRVTLQAQPSAAHLGQRVVLTTNVLAPGHPTTCAGMLVYAYSGLPVGCSAWIAPVVVCHPTVLGNYTVTVHVFAMNGFGSAGAALQVIP